MKKQLRELVRRLEFWPEEQQENAARILLEIEAQDQSPFHLTEEQTAEVARRLAEPNPKFLSLQEVRARFIKLGA